VIYLVRSWPRLSQTFIVNEVVALERRGIDIVLFSIVRSDEKLVQPQVRDVRAQVRYLAEDPLRERLGAHLGVLKASPLRYARGLLYALRHPELSEGYATCSTMACFRIAGQVAAEVLRLARAGRAPTHLHAHFAHDPALVALLVRRLTGLTFTFTAHARDLYQIPPESFRTRAAKAAAVVTCCDANADYIETISADEPAPVRVIHHGVELDQFRPASGPAQRADVPMLVSIGRMVEKKGFADLLHALHELATTGHSFRCRIYGDGPLRGRLTELRDSLGLTTQVEFPGEQDREGILEALGEADVFLLTPIVTDDGDRDGIPNVLVEAMACGLPVVATSAGGVGELVQEGVNGYLTEPGDVPGIAKGVAALLASHDLRSEMGGSARRTVEESYDVNAAARQLDELFKAAAS
jgi:glycosyltransferase involved in cell wall biosynthesis